jgi:hypothetical protein
MLKPWRRYAELSMHASTRILLLLLAAVAIAGGWWILLAINDAVIGSPTASSGWLSC